jgi:hypothetical protein
VAVDASSNLYVADTYDNRIQKLVKSGDIPGKATLLSPSGNISTSTPAYSWNAVSAATWYQVWVNDASAAPKIQQWYTAQQAGCASGTGTCSVTPSVVLASGAAQWWIQTWNDRGNGPWSDGMSFTVSGGVLPGKASLVSPSGSISTTTPIYTWNAVSNATWYYLWVDDSSTTAKVQLWYTAAQAGCSSGTGTCSVTPAATLALGLAQWWIQTWNSAGYGPWSDGMSFTVSGGVLPGKATLVSPSGSISTTTPTYIWNAVSNGTRYYLWVNDSSTAAKVQLWHTAAQAGCSSGTGTCSVTPTTALAQGYCQWWIQTWNSAGDGPWSDAMGFTAGGGGLSDVPTSWTAGAPPDLLGYKPFLSTNEWYRDVSGASVDPDSANIIADLVRDDPGTMLHPDFGSSLFEGNPVGIPYDVVASSETPMANVTIGPEGYADESDPGPDNPADRVPISVPIPADVHIEGGSDHHILLLDKDNYWLYELYHVVHLGDNSWQADQVTLWDLNDNTRRPWTWTSADQAGLSIFAGLVRYDEVQRALPANGDLGHAIRFTVMPTLEPFIPPATHPGGGNDPTVHSPKMGQRFRLKAAWLSTHLSEFSPQCQVILRTLAKYGMILADTGSNLFIQGTRDARWVEDADAGGVAQLLRVPPDAFEVVAHDVEYTRESHPTGLPPSIASFTATPASVSGGGAANLAWDITGASTLIITPGVGPVRGTSTVVHPTATTTYTIFATNEYGRSTRTVTVTVP